jgi:hypothetical protein
MRKLRGSNEAPPNPVRSPRRRAGLIKFTPDPPLENGYTVRSGVTGHKKNCLVCNRKAIREVVHKAPGGLVNYFRFCELDRCRNIAVDFAERVERSVKTHEVVDG